MDTKDVYNKIVPFLAEDNDVAEDKITSESHLIEDLEMDSLSVMELTVFTEDNFGVSVEEDFKEAINDPAVRKGMTVDWLVHLVTAQAD